MTGACSKMCRLSAIGLSKLYLCSRVSILFGILLILPSHFLLLELLQKYASDLDDVVPCWIFIAVHRPSVFVVAVDPVVAALVMYP